MIIDTPALHSVEYVYTIIINDIIHNFKHIAIVVKAQKQMLICRIIPNVIIYHIYNSVSNGSFGNVMLKGGRIELNNNIHKENIALERAVIKEKGLGIFFNFIMRRHKGVEVISGNSPFSP
jgi:hypothetical protein